MLLLIVSSSCADEKPGSRPYPTVDTFEVSELNETGVTLHGKIIDLGGGVTDHGFLYATSSISNDKTSTTDRMSLGPIESAGAFEAHVSRSLIKDKVYYYRAYAIGQAKGTTVLGQEFSFISQGGDPPSISDFYPKQGSIGDTVVFVGTSFSTSTANNIAMFGSRVGKVTAAKPDTLWVLVAAATPVGDNIVSVLVGDQNASASAKFKLLEITVESFEPKEVTFGQLVTIKGTNLPIHLSSEAVSMFNLPSAVVSSTRKELRVKVSNEVALLSSPVKFVAGIQEFEFPDQMTLLPPKILSFFPLGGTIGTIVTIQGENFSPVKTKNVVKMGGKSLEILEVDNSSIKVRVIQGIAPGSYNISVTTLGRIITSVPQFDMN